jgi:hypothetical protein
LPDLPAHAAYLRHKNECYDWGSYGWVLLQTGLVNIGKYRYFFFVNSSVRGPFLPAYARVSSHAVSEVTSSHASALGNSPRGFTCQVQQVQAVMKGATNLHPGASLM